MWNGQRLVCLHFFFFEEIAYVFSWNFLLHSYWNRFNSVHTKTLEILQKFLATYKDHSKKPRSRCHFYHFDSWKKLSGSCLLDEKWIFNRISLNQAIEAHSHHCTHQIWFIKIKSIDNKLIFDTVINGALRMIHTKLKSSIYDILK